MAMHSYCRLGFGKAPNQRIKEVQAIRRLHAIFVEKLYPDTDDRVTIATQLTQFRSGHGIAGRPLATAAASTMPACQWWLNFGASVPKLQELLCANSFMVKQHARVKQNGTEACLVSYRMTDVAV